MRITVVTGDEQIITLNNVDPSECVENVKALLEMETRVPLEQQKLVYKGREMSNSEKLSAIGVKDQDSVTMNFAAHYASGDLDGSAINHAHFQYHPRRDIDSLDQMLEELYQLFDLQDILFESVNNAYRFHEWVRTRLQRLLRIWKDLFRR